MSEVIRLYGESQLDYLWTHYKDYKVSTETSSTPSDEVILTESAILDLINDNTSAGIVSLTYREHPTKEDTMQLIGTAANGSILSIVEIPSEIHVESFTTRVVTLEDIDDGCTINIGTTVLSLVLTNGTEFLVDLSDVIKSFIKLDISGLETNTIDTLVNDNLIISNLKIDTANNSNSLVSINTNNNGIYANLNISESNYGIELVKESDGLAVRIPFNDSYLRFVSTTSDEYMLISDKDPATIYFLTDLPYIYLNGVRYGANISTGLSFITSISYDTDSMTLSYTDINGSKVNIVLGPANETTPGMMSVETYIDILNLKNTVDSLATTEYVQELVNQAGFSLTLGSENNKTIPINLVNGNGDIISTVNIDSESYLLFAESKVADASDVEASGNTVAVGDHILILTLTSGEVIYVSLNALVDTYSGGTTHSINTSVSNGVITSDLNISEDDLLLYISSDGLRALILVVRESGKLIFYGKSLTDEDKITEINLPDALVSFLFIEEATEEIFLQYPPLTIDGIEYDEYSNTVSFGDPYIILSFSQDSEYTIDSYSYNSWITVIPILKTIKLSPNEGNTLTKDENGYLFNAINWIEV